MYDNSTIEDFIVQLRNCDQPVSRISEELSCISSNVWQISASALFAHYFKINLRYSTISWIISSFCPRMDLYDHRRTGTNVLVITAFRASISNWTFYDSVKLFLVYFCNGKVCWRTLKMSNGLDTFWKFYFQSWTPNSIWWKVFIL
jgi:hypothetical protein